MNLFEKAMRQVELYGRRGWASAKELADTVPRVIRPEDWERRELTKAQAEGLARQWGRLNFQSVVRYVSKAPVFVHCHECRWPVGAGRTHMATGAGFYADGSNALPATEEQMQRICEGVRRHMGAA